MLETYVIFYNNNIADASFELVFVVVPVVLSFRSQLCGERAEMCKKQQRFIGLSRPGRSTATITRGADALTS